MPATRYQKRERAAQLAVFLKALSLGKTKKAAAEEAELCLRSLYRLRQTDAMFAERWQAALAAPDNPATDPLELEAQRRAVTGTEKPIFRGGALVGHTTDYSDSMLMFLLKAKYPEKYDRAKAVNAKTEASENAAGTDTSLNIAGARDALLSKFATAAQ